ncbi:MAG: hypothetical protein ACTSSE_09035 [Candidatus Thorarchaeota archaeon]
MKNQTPLILCLIGGFLLHSSHYTGGVDSILFIWSFLHGIPALDPYLLIIDIFLAVLYVVAWSGGIAVVLGGVLLTTSHVRIGKFIVAIAAGFGLISLILVIIGVVLVFGWAALLFLTWLIVSTPWALGLILTIIARSKAK